MLTILALTTLSDYGLAGATLAAVIGLLYAFMRWMKAKDKTFVDEINKRDEVIVNMQEKTIGALTESTIVIKENTEVLKDLGNDKK